MQYEWYITLLNQQRSSTRHKKKRNRMHLKVEPRIFPPRKKNKYSTTRSYVSGSSRTARHFFFIITYCSIPWPLLYPDKNRRTHQAGDAINSLLEYSSLLSAADIQNSRPHKPRWLYDRDGITCTQLWSADSVCLVTPFAHYVCINLHGADQICNWKCSKILQPWSWY